MDIDQAIDRKGLGDGPNSWKVVYQSGHGTVFCNGDRHFWLSGEFWGAYPLAEFPEDGFDVLTDVSFGNCNCSAYRQSCCSTKP